MQRFIILAAVFTAVHSSFPEFNPPNYLANRGLQEPLLPFRFFAPRPLHFRKAHRVEEKDHFQNHNVKFRTKFKSKFQKIVLGIGIAQ